MGTSTQPSAGKATAPPQPAFGGSTQNLKPMEVAPGGGGAGVYNTKPMEMSNTFSTKPMEVGFDGGAVQNTKPLEMSNTYSTKPMQVGGGGTPTAGGSDLIYNQNGVSITSGGLRTYADGSTEQMTPNALAALRPGATQGLVQAGGNGGALPPMPSTGVNMGAGAGQSPGGNMGTSPPPMGSHPSGASWGGGGYGTSQVPGAVDDTSRQRVEQAILSRLEPQFRADEASMRNQLLSSGLEVGSPAYTSELNRLKQGQTDARQSAILNGGQEESRQVGLNAALQAQGFGQGMARDGQNFNQSLQGAQFDNQTRQQMLAELLLQRNTPLNELNALRTGNQVAMPSFSGYYTTGAQAAPMFDAATAQGNYNSNQAAQAQSGTNALISGGATALGMFF